MLQDERRQPVEGDEAFEVGRVGRSLGDGVEDARVLDLPAAIEERAEAMERNEAAQAGARVEGLLDSERAEEAGQAVGEE
jgi:hypothetical protein